MDMEGNMSLLEQIRDREHSGVIWCRLALDYELVS